MDFGGRGIVMVKLDSDKPRIAPYQVISVMGCIDLPAEFFRIVHQPQHIIDLIGGQDPSKRVRPGRIGDVLYQWYFIYIGETQELVCFHVAMRRSLKNHQYIE